MTVAVWMTLTLITTEPRFGRCGAHTAKPKFGVVIWMPIITRQINDGFPGGRDVVEIGRLGRLDADGVACRTRAAHQRDIVYV